MISRLTRRRTIDCQGHDLVLADQFTIFAVSINGGMGSLRNIIVQNCHFKGLGPHALNHAIRIVDVNHGPGTVKIFNNQFDESLLAEGISIQANGQEMWADGTIVMGGNNGCNENDDKGIVCWGNVGDKYVTKPETGVGNSLGPDRQCPAEWWHTVYNLCP